MSGDSEVTVDQAMGVLERAARRHLPKDADWDVYAVPSGRHVGLVERTTKDGVPLERSIHLMLVQAKDPGLVDSIVSKWVSER